MVGIYRIHGFLTRGVTIIIFENIKWRNFLSTGNVFTEVTLNTGTNTLFIGENGSGKSTILDAITFVLFGKPFRKINKPMLVNSVNEKGAEVQIEFGTNGRKYRIVRGIKPNIFEIYCDGVLINQDSTSKDYQEHLEKVILKMNYKSFTQIVILGAATFTPFMQLTPADRRAVIEDLLDIEIFSVMNVIVKQKLLTIRDDLEKNNISSLGKKEKQSVIERTLNSLKATNDETIRALENRREDVNSQIESTESKIEELETKCSSITENMIDISNLRSKHRKLISLQSKMESNHARHVEMIDFLTSHDHCPTCQQAIEEEFKSLKIKNGHIKTSEIDGGINDIKVMINDIISQIGENENMMKSLNSLNTEISNKRIELKSLNTMMLEINDSISKSREVSKLVHDNEKELKAVKKELKELERQKQTLLDEKVYTETAISLLKDGGIKTKIIKQYLPIINKLINKYLSKMGFFVNFNINEQFEESIKSRYRDEFSYQNFSEGEKMKIDMAILLAWRGIAKMRNSINCNILMLDEVFDSSLDANSTEGLMTILKEFDTDTNIFVISHKGDALIDKFDSVITFAKVKNFSRIINS